MKLSAVVLLGVNFVAASQVANAADTASFLQDALSPSGSKSARTAAQGAASAPAARSAAAGRRQAKNKHSSAYVAMTPVMDGVKIRPFMPGRYLPSEAELEARKQAELAAKQAAAQRYNPGDVLTGQVSSSGSNTMAELGSAIAPAAAYALSRPVNQGYMHKVAQVAIQKVKQAARNYSSAHSRAVPGISPVLPGQVAKLPGSAGALPVIPDPPAASAAAATLRVPQPQNSRPSFPVKVPQYNAAAPTGVVESPELTAYEASQLDKLVVNNMPENVYAKSFNGDMRASGQGNPAQAGGGPPPFPLSNLPVNSRGRAINPAVSQARFGSWHGGNSGLAQASFQSYVPIHMCGPMSVKVAQHGSSNRTGHQSSISASHHASASATPAKKPGAAAAAHKPQPHVAMYAPYRRYNLY